MLDEKDGNAEFIPQAADEGSQVFGFTRVHAGAGFIQEEQFWFGREGTRDFKTALRAVGQVACHHVALAFQSHEIQQSLRFSKRDLLLLVNFGRTDDRAYPAGVLEDMLADEDVFEGAHFGKKPEV